ncbi:MAG: RbsD/FucU domain-containing protein [Eubacteriales bacterium]|nr:RbsD/FucU domain-containing protein [Eubacteriales bacterium]
MLLNVPKLMSPQLLEVLCEMGHSDVIVLGDANFPGKRFAQESGCKFLRADGIPGPALLEAVLSMIPLDSYVEAPVQLMQKMDCDRDMEIPIWEEYKAVVARHDPRGEKAVGFTERFAFYEAAKKAYCIVQTGEEAVYANVMIQKGVVK